MEEHPMETDDQTTLRSPEGEHGVQVVGDPDDEIDADQGVEPFFERTPIQPTHAPHSPSPGRCVSLYGRGRTRSGQRAGGRSARTGSESSLLVGLRRSLAIRTVRLWAAKRRPSALSPGHAGLVRKFGGTGDAPGLRL